jgi:predicted ribosomally synthesized peptide with SipW-like signal peptide
MSHGTNRRKVLAVLAGGLVLGIGTAVTLAAWNDSEFAASTFAAGAFDLEGATDGAAGAYADHESAGEAAALTFTVEPENLSPADVVYAPYWVRLDAATTTGGTLAVDAIAATPGTPDATPDLAHALYAIGPDAPCDATATSGTLVASGATADSLTAGADVALSAGAAGSAGAPVQLCFVVTAGDALEQGATSTVTWSFLATQG